MTDYGRAISCTDSLHSGRYAVGLRAVAEACYRRLITRQGELMDDALYGLRLRDYLGSVTSDADIARLPGLIRSQLQQDGRIESVDVTIDETVSGAERYWTITLDVLTGKGPFELVLEASGVSLSMVGFE